MKKLLDVLKTSAYHDMPAEICKYCKQPHHWVVCIEDLLMGLDNSGKLLEKWKRKINLRSTKKTKKGGR
jgi:hypothetical protein